MKVFQIKFEQNLWKFMGYMKKSIYDLMKIGLYHQSVWLEVEIAQHLIIETSHFKFQ
jgi:hypothetical protein